MNRQEKTKKNHRNMAPYLCKAWDIRVIQARYSEDGNWYGALEKFPAALLDANGYVIFDTEEEYRSCPQLKITKQINVPQGISAIPAFIKMHISEEQFQDAVRAALSDEPETRRKRLENAPTIPNKITVKSVVFERNPDVVAEVLFRANGFCEYCKNPAPFIRHADNSPYLEVHHKIKLADGGEDTIGNAVGLCPNCHRKAHYG